MRAFVTGSTGLLGSNLVQILVSEGHQVKALVRTPEKARKLFQGLDVEFAQGDMQDVAGFAAHLRGCDVLFHTAAYFREYFDLGDHWQQLYNINVASTIRLLEAAEAHGVSKTIYVSSGGVIGANPAGGPSDESIGPDHAVMGNLYFKSKVAAEEAVAEFLRSHPHPVVLILPGAIFGPQDSAPTAAGQFVLDVLHGRLPAIPPGGFSTVDTRDVARAMIDAVEKGKSGERYIISDRFYPMSQILALIGEAGGVPVPRMKLPFTAGLWYARFSEFGARLTGSKPQATVQAIRTMHDGRDLLADKARRELGLTLRPLRQTIRDMVDWYGQNGYIRRKIGQKTG